MITSYAASQFYSVDYESLNCNEVQLQNLPFSAPYGVTILGSCNGLLCIRIHDAKYVCYDAIIWNPLFKSYKRVSSFITSGWEWDSVLLGFGYDSFTDDYKFVKVYNKRHKGEVYTMKTNSWRNLPLESDLSDFCFWDVGTYFNGSIYWVDVPMLIEFDLKNEKFRLVKLPIHRFMQVKLFIVKGCLGVFAASDHYEYFNLLMIKKDSCNVISWSKVNIRRPECRMGEAICLKTNNEIVMRIKNDWWISSDEEELVSEKDGPVHEAPATSESGKVLMHTVLPMQQDLRYSRDDLIIYNPLEGTVKNGPIGGARDWSEYTIYIETLVTVLMPVLDEEGSTGPKQKR